MELFWLVMEKLKARNSKDIAKSVEIVLIVNLN